MPKVMDLSIIVKKKKGSFVTSLRVYTLTCYVKLSHSRGLILATVISINGIFFNKLGSTSVNMSGGCVEVVGRFPFIRSGPPISPGSGPQLKSLHLRLIEAVPWAPLCPPYPLMGPSV
jgi:hypothetical protein